MAQPRVAIMSDSMHSMGGAERVTLAISEIFPDAPIYTPLYNHDLDKFFGNKKIITSYLQKWSFIPAKYLFPFLPAAVESFDFSDFDIVISSSNSYAKNILTKPSTTHISYIHAPMRYVWDAAHEYTPAQTLWWPARSIVANLLHKIRIWDQYGASRVDIYLANSKNTANRIKKYYRKDSQVVYPPVSTDQISAQAEHKDYFLVISRLSQYKRVDLAVDACNELKLPLIVLGSGEELENLRKLAGPTVQVIGWVDDKEKYDYLQNCRALIFPGEEDFGIVPVEAMAAGKPVIAYKKGGLLETVIDGETGVFFEDQTVISLVEALKKFIAGESLAGQAQFNWQGIRKHSEQFSPTVFKQKLTALVDEIMRSHG